VKVGHWLSHLEFEVNSPVWGHFLDALSARYTLLRYDQRGTGCRIGTCPTWASRPGRRSANRGGRGRQERFALLGMSQGAPVGIAYAVRHPERVSHLILHGGYARGRKLRGDAGRGRTRRHHGALAELGWGGDDPSFRQFFTSQFIPEGSAEQHRWFNELERVSASPQNAARLMRTLNVIDVADLLPAVSCPTLVLHATHDLRVPFAEGRLLASGIAQARFVPLDTPHHLMLATDPAWRAGRTRCTISWARHQPARCAPGEPHAARTRTPGPDRPGARQRADRRRARPEREDGAQPHHQHLRQAGSGEPLAGHRPGARKRIDLTPGRGNFHRWGHGPTDRARPWRRGAGTGPHAANGLRRK
jgi:pimeloyl-ACP methyl ester carboxylesterase